jgi:signal transduction histidine kinase
MIAGLLVAFGYTLALTTRKTLMENLDRDLQLRVERYRGEVAGGPPMGQRQAPGFGMGPGPGGGRMMPRGQGMGPGPGPGPGGPGSFPWFRRPTFFDAELGTPLEPGEPRSPVDPAAIAAAMRGKTGFSDAHLDDVPLRVYTAPASRDDGTLGAIQVAAEVGDFSRFWAKQMETTAWFVPVALLVAGIGGLFLANRALRPIQQVTTLAAEIGATDLGKRLPVQGTDELATMAGTFNAMLDRLDRSLRETEATLERQRQFTADASHELRTPLARIKLTSSVALATATEPDDLRQALTTVDEAADAVSRLVQQLLTLARADAGQLVAGSCDAEAAVREALSAFQDARLQANLTPGVRAAISHDALARIVSNLVENALRYTPAPGSVHVRLASEAARVTLEVRDTGEGIAPEHLPHVAERFYRADAARSREDGGCGLGLAIVQALAEAARGTLSVESQVGTGTTVRVVLPSAAT